MTTEKAKHKSEESQAIIQMKQLAIEMLKKPDLAEKAVHDRNIIIKGLKADIEHRKVAFKEIETRYSDALTENIKLDILVKTLNSTIVDFENKNLELQSKIKILNEQNFLLTKAYDEEKLNSDRKWIAQIEKISNLLPPVVGNVIKFIFTPPISSYLWLMLFGILFIASFTGWGVMAQLLTPIFKLFKILLPIGD